LKSFVHADAARARVSFGGGVDVLFDSVNTYFGLSKLRYTHLNVIAEFKETRVSGVELIRLPQPRPVLNGTKENER
jgi:hypothetical protein